MDQNLGHGCESCHPNEGMIAIALGIEEQEEKQIMKNAATSRRVNRGMQEVASTGWAVAETPPD